MYDGLEALVIELEKNRRPKVAGRKLKNKVNKERKVFTHEY